MMTKMEPWIRSLGGLGVIAVLASSAAAAGTPGTPPRLRLPEAFLPPVRECRLDPSCRVDLETSGSRLVWHVQCGQAPDADAGQRLARLKQREQDALVIVVTPSRRAWQSRIEETLAELGMSSLLTDGRIRVVRVEKGRPDDQRKRMADLCAVAVGSGAMAFVPNTGFVFVGERSEAPDTNPCRDDRWRDGVPVLDSLDDVEAVVGEKASSILLTLRQIQDIENFQERFCEETGDATEYAELVIPNPGAPGRDGADRSVKAADLGVADGKVRSQLGRLGIQIESRHLSRLKMSELRVRARRGEDGRYSVPLAEVRRLVDLAADRASKVDFAGERKRLLARLSAALKALESLNQEFVVVSWDGPELTREAVLERAEAAMSKYNRLCGESDQPECERIGKLLIEVRRGSDALDGRPGALGRPSSVRGYSSSTQPELSAEDAHVWIETSLRRLEGLRVQVERCAFIDCLEQYSNDLGRVEVELTSREAMVREVALAEVTATEEGRLLRLNSVLVKVEQQLASLGSTGWSTMRIAGVATIGGGALVGLAAIAPFVLASKENDKLRKMPASPQRTKKVEYFNQLQYSGFALAAIGGAAILAGAVVLIVDNERSKPPSVGAAVVPTRGGAAFGIAGSF